MNVPRVHRLLGIVVVVIFLGTGLYMRLRFPGLYAGNESIRFLFRANHIYLLLAGLLNVVLGLYLVLHTQRWKRRLQVAGSVLLLVAPVVLLVAFFVEPPHASPERPMTAVGLFMLLIGTGLHLLTRWLRRR